METVAAAAFEWAATLFGIFILVVMAGIIFLIINSYIFTRRRRKKC